MYIPGAERSPPLFASPDAPPACASPRSECRGVLDVLGTLRSSRGERLTAVPPCARSGSPKAEPGDPLAAASCGRRGGACRCWQKPCGASAGCSSFGRPASRWLGSRARHGSLRVQADAYFLAPFRAFFKSWGYGGGQAIRLCVVRIVNGAVYGYTRREGVRAVRQLCHFGLNIRISVQDRCCARGWPASIAAWRPRSGKHT